MVSKLNDSAARFAGDLGSEFAAEGDRYLPRGGVRHRTRLLVVGGFTRISLCGVSASEVSLDGWRGTGSQDEYERLSSIPRCTRCIAAEKRS